MGSHDFTFHPPLLDHSQSLDHIACHYADPSYSGLIAAACGPQSSKPMGTAPVRMPLPFDLTEEPIYVNSKQYHAILRRRQRRQYCTKLEAHNKPIKDRKPYLHKSRHLHALKRARGAGGRFLNTKNLQESKLTSVNHSYWNVSQNMHHVDNHRDGASTTTCSDVACASNSDEIFLNHTADEGGGANQYRLSIFM